MEANAATKILLDNKVMLALLQSHFFQINEYKL